jgi:hypothetical protein
MDHLDGFGTLPGPKNLIGQSNPLAKISDATRRAVKAVGRRLPEEALFRSCLE